VKKDDARQRGEGVKLRCIWSSGVLPERSCSIVHSPIPRRAWWLKTVSQPLLMFLAWQTHIGRAARSMEWAICFQCWSRGNSSYRILMMIFHEVHRWHDILLSSWGQFHLTKDVSSIEILNFWLKKSAIDGIATRKSDVEFRTAVRT
jgi:hypothetical protein